MLPLVASALLSVAGQVAFKLISSALSRDKTPAAEAPRADAPKGDFATMLKRSQTATTPSPTMLASTGSPMPLDATGTVAVPAPTPAGDATSTLPIAAPPSLAPLASGVNPDLTAAGLRGATTNLHAAADAYQRVNDYQAP